VDRIPAWDRSNAGSHQKSEIGKCTIKYLIFSTIMTIRGILAVHKPRGETSFRIVQHLQFLLRGMPSIDDYLLVVVISVNVRASWVRSSAFSFIMHA
jgi:hypothetical protein